ncbi:MULTISPECIES: LexA family protein [unclassified Aerococcus]|uniref:LexA family protein n=1 Tax=unclassified Aerococcus TaxID=2618060 RepID=UPI0025C4D26B|nr:MULTISPECIES: XRE family transcriptional regulator [unclassified Aerococcus]
MEEKTTAQTQRNILASNLKELADKKRVTQADIVRDLELSESTVRSWFNGEKYPRIQKLQLLAEYFNVPRSRLTEKRAENLSIATLKRIPVLGEIACGDPITADENIIDYRDEIAEQLPTGDLFYLKAKGESMSPTITNGSYVLIKAQPNVENGEIAAVLVNGDTEATLKRVKRQGDIVMLVADNPEYMPYVITKDNPARIIGKAIKMSVDL